jgi:hypothetical protein
MRHGLNKSSKKLTPMRRKSLILKKNPISTVTSLEQEIKQLQIRNQLDLPLLHQQQQARRLSTSSNHSSQSSAHHHHLLDTKSKIVLTTSNSNIMNSNKNIEPINFKSHFLSNFESRLANIGKLDAKKMDSLAPNRSSTPDDNQFQFKSNSK